MHIVLVENHPKDDGGDVLIAVAAAHGALCRELVSAAPLEALREHFPAWDGEIESLLQSAYAKYNIADPRPLKAELKGLSRAARLEKLPLPKGAVTAEPSKDSSSIDKLLQLGHELQARNQARGRQVVSDSESSDDDNNDNNLSLDDNRSPEYPDDNRSPVKPKSIFDTPVLVGGKRRRSHVKPYTAGPASDKAQRALKKKPAATTQPRVRRPATAPEMISPGKLKMSKDLQAAKLEREKEKVRAKKLEHQLATMSAQVTALLVQQGAEDSSCSSKSEIEKLKLLCFSMKAIAMAHAQDGTVMNQALERVAKNFGIDLSD
jgi:hypothetical protein